MQEEYNGRLKSLNKSVSSLLQRVSSIVNLNLTFESQVNLDESKTIAKQFSGLRNYRIPDRKSLFSRELRCYILQFSLHLELLLGCRYNVASCPLFASIVMATFMAMPGLVLGCS